MIWFLIRQDFISHFTFQYQCRIMTIMIVPLLFWVIARKDEENYRTTESYRKKLNAPAGIWTRDRRLERAKCLTGLHHRSLRTMNLDLHIKLMSSYVLCGTYISEDMRFWKFFKLFVNSYLLYLSITVSINFYNIATYT